jgi:Uma2 family endonuclease
MGSEVTVSALLDQRQVWTFEDLQQLPEDVEWRRYEIVDGALVVSPSPDLRHDYVEAMLRRALDHAAAPDYLVTGSAGVDLGTSYRVPDLKVLPLPVAATDARVARPSDVLLAVEVVSPGSVTNDRVTKPAQYAAAGIRSYWRVETRPVVTLAVYELPPGSDTYTEVGTWGPGEVAHLDRPFPVDVAIDDLVPPAPAQADG